MLYNYSSVVTLVHLHIGQSHLILRLTSAYSCHHKYSPFKAILDRNWENLPHYCRADDVSYHVPSILKIELISIFAGNKEAKEHAINQCKKSIQYATHRQAWTLS
jgi:hypothetical protein